MNALDLILPYPPSVNSYWRHPTTGRLAGRHLISAEGRTYRESVAWRLMRHRAPSCSGPLSLELVAHPPDSRLRDLDNLLKAVCDSLEYAGLVENDSQFKKILLEWGGRHPGGAVRLLIQDWDQPPRTWLGAAGRGKAVVGQG